MGEGDAIRHTATLEERRRIVEIIRKHKLHAETQGELVISEGDVNQHAAGLLAKILEEMGVDPGAVCDHPNPMCLQGPCRACGDE